MLLIHKWLSRHTGISIISQIYFYCLYTRHFSLKLKSAAPPLCVYKTLLLSDMPFRL